MALSPKEAKAISEISEIFYSFLPGKPHPYANQSISFKGVANDMGLSQFWMDGSKGPSINILLSQTLEKKRGEFCNLILNIVNKGMIYRSKKSVIKRDEINKLNEQIRIIGFKIPELWDRDFLDSLPNGDGINNAHPKNEKQEQAIDYIKLQDKFLEISKLEPQSRGFAFEKFLNELFEEFGLNPRKSFRLVGEQIDGSLDLAGNIYLIEAKWQNNLVGNSDLLSFQGKITGKSSWTRGIFISINGFSDEGLMAFGRGRPTNIIAISGQDLYAILYKKLSLINCINMKIRWAAETGEIAKSIFELATE